MPNIRHHVTGSFTNAFGELLPLLQVQAHQIGAATHPADRTGAPAKRKQSRRTAEREINAKLTDTTLS